MTTALVEVEDTIRRTPPRPHLVSAGPATIAQQNAWEKFDRLPMPLRKDENWRFAKICSRARAASRRLAAG